MALRRYTLGVLLCVYLFNFIDRQIIAILGEQIKTELVLSDTQMGFLTGLAFAIFYSIAGVPIALVADRTNRKNLISYALGTWSLMTAVCGLAQNFAQLAIARIGVGIGEAGCSPPAHSLISDMFRRDERATALGIYGLGVPFGTLFGLMIGGYLSQEFGWRSALFIVGAPGILLAVIVRFTVKEPRRGSADGLEERQRGATLREAARYLFAKPTYRNLLIGGSIITGVNFGMIMWTPSFLIRTHGMGTGEIGLWLGLSAGIPGGIGMYAGGYLADFFGRKYGPKWRLWLSAIALSFVFPFAIAAYLAESSTAALVFLTVPFMLNNFHQATMFAQTQGVADISMRATAAAIMLGTLGLIGYGGGPQIVGILSDVLRSQYGDESLRYALALFSTFALWAGWHFYRAGKTLESDLV